MLWGSRSSRTPVILAAAVVFVACVCCHCCSCCRRRSRNRDRWLASFKTPCSIAGRDVSSPTRCFLVSARRRSRRSSARRSASGWRGSSCRSRRPAARPRGSRGAAAIRCRTRVDLRGRQPRVDAGRGDRRPHDCAVSAGDARDRSRRSSRRAETGGSGRPRRHTRPRLEANHLAAHRADVSCRRHWSSSCWRSPSSPFPACLRVRVFTTEVFTAFAALYDFGRATTLAIPLLMVSVVLSQASRHLHWEAGRW